MSEGAARREFVHTGEFSPGGVRLRRRSYWVREEDGETVECASPVGGTGREGRPSLGFSNASREEFRWQMNSTDWEAISGELAMVTLTYPAEFPTDGEVCKAQLAAFVERWRRKWGAAPVGWWVQEFQERGALHFHLYVGMPAGTIGRTGSQRLAPGMHRDGVQHDAERPSTDGLSEWVWPWALDAWADIVGSSDWKHRYIGVDVRPCFWGEDTRNVTALARYFFKESGKWGQKQVPEDFANPGRFWGKWGVPMVVHEVDLTWRHFVEMRRPLRVFQRKQARRRLRSRGNRGLTVYCNDGVGVGVRLARWAEGRPQAGRNFAGGV